MTCATRVRKRGLRPSPDDDGCHSCHTHMSCTTFCPKALEPTYAIAGLKRMAMRRSLSRGSWGAKADGER